MMCFVGKAIRAGPSHQYFQRGPPSRIYPTHLCAKGFPRPLARGVGCWQGSLIRYSTAELGASKAKDRH